MIPLPEFFRGLAHALANELMIYQIQRDCPDYDPETERLMSELLEEYRRKAS